MALIGNYSVLNKSNTRYSNGTSTAGAYAGNTRSNWNNPTQQFAKVNNSFPARTSIPQGYGLGEAYTKPRTSGGLASFLSGSGSLAAGGISARLSDATMSGSGDLVGSLGAIVQAASAMSGSGSMTSNLGILSNVTSSLSGSGSLAANLSATVALNSSLSGSGSIASNLKGTGSLAASIIIGATDPLSAENLANAVWNEDLSTYNVANSAGKKVNDLSGGGASLSDIEDAVWNAPLADHTTSGTFGWFIKKLLTVGKFLGLK